MANEHAQPQTAPYGSWSTPFTSELVSTSSVALSDVRVDRSDVIWSEGRAVEGGRIQLVRRDRDGRTTELLPPGRNARTAVHEYGGGAWWVRDGIVWFADWSDQRLYRRDPGSGRAEPLVPEPEIERGDRYADGDLSPDRESIACIREHHSRGAMPWDRTRQRVRDLSADRDLLVAGDGDESVLEPSWQSDGSLTFISDRTGWWNLYRWSPVANTVEPLVEIDADIGVPQWLLGLSRYAFLSDGRVVFARTRDGLDGLGLRQVDGTVVDLELPYTTVSTVRAAGDDSVVLVAGTPTAELSVVRVTLPDGGGAPAVAALRQARKLDQLGIDSRYLSVPEVISFPSESGRTAAALFYRPANPRYAGPEGELPPLLVAVHGGPTGAANAHLQLGIQYWTSRGFALVDVNYGGSTGYGRAYRQLLQGAWGVVDVEDAAAAARWLADQGLVDPARMCIRGGSAGGYTTLAAMSQPDTPFAAGADFFGLADLEVFVGQTHKFESRYLDGLLGPYPAARELYRERSPLYHVEEPSRPLLVLQGLEDKIVPPNQAELIVEPLRRRGIPVAVLLFEGEQHGFRRAETIRRALDAELSFYAQVLGFELPDGERIEPVAIENLTHIS
jgi:dipeptidyl aminopeptidase/acylaminoacyl peptidase